MVLQYIFSRNRTSLSSSNQSVSLVLILTSFNRISIMTILKRWRWPNLLLAYWRRNMFCILSKATSLLSRLSHFSVLSILFAYRDFPHLCAEEMSQNIGFSLLQTLKCKACMGIYGKNSDSLEFWKGSQSNQYIFK